MCRSLTHTNTHICRIEMILKSNNEKKVKIKNKKTAHYRSSSTNILLYIYLFTYINDKIDTLNETIDI